MKRSLFATLIVLALCLPAVAADESEEQGPLMWLAFSKVKSGKTEDAVKHSMHGAEMMTKLIADGVVISWGLATPINHRPGDTWNHVEWVTLPDWDAVEAWAGAAFAQMQSRSPEEQANLQREFESIYVEGSHFDQVVRHIVAEGTGRPGYIYLAHFDVKPGQGDNVASFFTDVVEPSTSALVGEGALVSYGAYVHELHGAPGATSHTFWYGLKSLGSIDTMVERFESAQDADSDARAGQVISLGSHYDQVLMVLHYQDR